MVIYKYQVIADENNRGRHIILESGLYQEAAQLVKEINAGFFPGCLMYAELKVKAIL